MYNPKFGIILAIMVALATQSHSRVITRGLVLTDRLQSPLMTSSTTQNCIVAYTGPSVQDLKRKLICLPDTQISMPGSQLAQNVGQLGNTNDVRGNEINDILTKFGMGTSQSDGSKRTIVKHIITQNSGQFKLDGRQSINDILEKYGMGASQSDGSKRTIVEHITAQSSGQSNLDGRQSIKDKVSELLKERDIKMNSILQQVKTTNTGMSNTVDDKKLHDLLNQQQQLLDSNKLNFDIDGK